MPVEIIKYGDIQKAFDEAAKKANIVIGMKLVARAKALAPVDMGRLRNSIMWKTPTHKGGFNESGGEPATEEIKASPKPLEGYFGFNLNYGVYQEYGTRYMAPQPFMRPAIMLVRGESKDDVIKVIEKEIAHGPLSEGQKRETF